MTDQRQETGEWGERVAERYLRKREGMVVLDRRWRHEHGELDLIMRQGGVMVFVEVRVRTGGGDPLATYRSIGRGKWRVLRKTAKAYLWQCRWRPEAVRFDVVGIQRTEDGKFLDLDHWENVGTFGRGWRY
jgi:putative endonuclease